MSEQSWLCVGRCAWTAGVERRSTMWWRRRTPASSSWGSSSTGILYSVRHGRNRAESILDGSDLELLGKLDASHRHLEFRVWPEPILATAALPVGRVSTFKCRQHFQVLKKSEYIIYVQRCDTSRHGRYRSKFIFFGFGTPGILCNDSAFHFCKKSNIYRNWNLNFQNDFESFSFNIVSRSLAYFRLLLFSFAYC